MGQDARVLHADPFCGFWLGIKIGIPVSLAGVLDKMSGMEIRYLGDLFGHQHHHRSLEKLIAPRSSGGLSLENFRVCIQT